MASTQHQEDYEVFLAVGKIVIVGTGFSGAVIARKIAEELDRSVIVIEKRAHIAGNMYDEVDEHGILVQRYGPHVVVTNRWSVIDYLSQYSELFKHTVKELSFIDGNYVRLPFNFESVQQLIGGQKAEILIAKLRRKYRGRDRVPVLELANNTDVDISGFGNLLFEKAYRTYCAKQWDIPVETLDKTIMDRVPMAMSYDERYMDKDFQYLPKSGFTALFRNMLNHPNISFSLNDDALTHITLDEPNKNILFDGEQLDLLVYTGAVDELFALKYGELPYRSLNIQYQWFDKEQVYPEKIISFPQAAGYTRKTEYKFMMYDNFAAKGSVIATEYPTAYVKGGTLAPFYPVITDENKSRYELYRKEAESYGNIFLSGRLADFRYYNMDDCILHAFEVFDEIKDYLTKTGNVGEL